MADDVVVTLRESEARFRLLFENLSFGVAYRDRERNLLWANPAARRILDLGPRWDAIHEDGTPYPPEERPSAVALRTGKPVSSVVAGIWDPIRKSRVWVLVSAIPEFGPGESQASHVFVVFENITPLLEAQEKLRLSEEQFRAIFENAAVGVAQVDPITGRILLVNPKLAAITGYSSDELLSRRFAEITHPEDRDRTGEGLERARTSGASGYEIEERYVRKDGSVVRVAVQVTIQCDDAGRSTRALCVIEDITAAKQAEEALRRKDEALEQALAVGDIGTWTADLVRGTLDFSQTSARHRGVTPGTYPTEELFKSVHPDDVARVKAAFSGAVSGVPYDVEFRVLVGDEVRWVHSKCRVERDQTGKPVAAFGMTQDLTERVRLEERLRRSQKLEAIGQLAGGVAHDFNNALLVIGGNAEVILSVLPDDDPNRRALTDIQAASARAAGLTQQLLAFGRKQMLEPRLVDAHEAVAGVTRALGPLLCENIEIRTAFSAVSTWVKVDPNQLEEALVHLSLNARDAMPAGGRITIRTHNVEPSESVNSDPTAGPRQLQKIAISVTDTGRGMPPEVKSRLFEPFFTTKEFGHSSGLGLATIFGFVKQSGGDITVESEPGKGATFTIVLPVESAP